MSFKIRLLLISPLMFDLLIAFSTVHPLEFGGKGSGPGQFGSTIYVAFGRADTIYVSDPANSRIQIFTPQGRFLRSICPSRNGEFQFNRIGELAVGHDGSIWVADWKTEPLPGEEAPSSARQAPIHFLTPCVHHFDPTGGYLGAVIIDSTASLMERNLIPALDKEGKVVFLIRSHDFDRPLHLTTGRDGSLYVSDENRNTVYCYTPSGKLKLRFGGFGQLDHPQAVDCDWQGNIYVADSGNHRIVKFAPSGKLLFSVGRKGLGDLQFISPYLVRVTRDAGLLVADRSRFKKGFKSYLPERGESSAEANSLKEDKGREYLVWLRRIQSVGLNGGFVRKILLRFTDREKRVKLLAIDRKGTLFLFDPETHRIKTESLSLAPIQKRFLQKSYRIKVEKGIRDFNVDSGWERRVSDLDYNYLTDLKLITLSQSLLLQYDFTEKLRTWAEATAFYLHAYRSTRYPQEKPPPGGWVYDRLLFDDLLDGTIRFGLEVVLDQNPYEYRELHFFLSLGNRVYDFYYDMLSRENRMHGTWHLWQSKFGAGIDWDITHDLNVYFAVFLKNPGDVMNYRYRHWSEEGKLRSQGWFRGRTTIAYGGINIVF